MDARSDRSDARFDALYREFFPRLVGYCKRMGTNGWAEDVAQETLVRALARLDTIDLSRPLWPWLKTVAFRLASDATRKRSREVPTEALAESEPLEEPVALEAIEERTIIAAAMSSLRPAERTAIGLRYLEDLDNAEAAPRLAITGTAFKQLVYRARARLRVEYGRLSNGAVVVVLLPIRLARRGMRSAIERTQRGLGAVRLSAEVFHHALPGLVTLALLAVVPDPAGPAQGSRAATPAPPINAEAPRVFARFDTSPKPVKAEAEARALVTPIAADEVSADEPAPDQGTGTGDPGTGTGDPGTGTGDPEPSSGQTVPPAAEPPAEEPTPLVTGGTPEIPPVNPEEVDGGAQAQGSGRADSIPEAIIDAVEGLVEDQVPSSEVRPVTAPVGTP